MQFFQVELLRGILQTPTCNFPPREMVMVPNQRRKIELTYELKSTLCLDVTEVNCTCYARHSGLELRRMACENLHSYKG